MPFCAITVYKYSLLVRCSRFCRLDTPDAAPADLHPRAAQVLYLTVLGGKTRFAHCPFAVLMGPGVNESVHNNGRVQRITLHGRL